MFNFFKKDKQNIVEEEVQTLSDGESNTDSFSLYVNGKGSTLHKGDDNESCFDFIMFFNK